MYHKFYWVSGSDVCIMVSSFLLRQPDLLTLNWAMVGVTMENWSSQNPARPITNDLPTQAMCVCVCTI